VLPGFGLAYLVAGPPRLGHRVWQLLLIGFATIAAGGWWVAIVQLTPASARPYIGGSQNNSFWNVLFGYNGLGRLTGSEAGSVGGAPGGQGGQWGPTGWTRLFNDSFGGQASWLIPSALVLLVGGLVWTVYRRRTDRTRAALILWGGWLLVTGVAISLGKGIIHEYYTVALVPAIGALVGIGGALLWRRRDHWFARGTLAVAVLVTAIWAETLLGRTPDWMPWLRPTILGAGIFVSIALLFPLPRLATTVMGAALVIALAGPAAYTLSTVRTAQAGALPSAGPAGAGRGIGPGGRGFPGGGGPGAAFGPNGAVGAPPGLGNLANGGPGFPGGPGGFAGNPGGAGNAGAANGRPGGGGLGGLLNGTSVSSRVATLLVRGSDGYRWAAATVGANNAASYQLAAGEPIMAIGGFNGSDPAPTLAQFQAYVRQGAIHYFIGGGGMGGPDGGGAGGSSGTSSAITSWVAAHFSATTVGGVTLYDLSTT
jgi:4-amino-4-deoxy-L-arabinose transferase-like glycosyltransferase